MSAASVPSYYDLLWPTLHVVIAMDGSGRLDEINRAVIERQGFDEIQQGSCTETVLKPSRIPARLDADCLKGMGLLENGARGARSRRSSAQNLRTPTQTMNGSSGSSASWCKSRPTDSSASPAVLLREAGFINATITGISKKWS